MLVIGRIYCPFSIHFLGSFINYVLMYASCFAALPFLRSRTRRTCLFRASAQIRIKRARKGGRAASFARSVIDLISNIS